MKNIQVSKEKVDNKLFSIQGYNFIEIESNYSPIPIYRVIINKKFESPLDVRFWFEDINDKNFPLAEAPVELSELIKEHEENIKFKDNYLFHDLRTRYVDFYLYEENGLKNNVLLIGYTLLEDVTCFGIKAFSLRGLTAFTQKFLNYCIINKIDMEYQKNLQWIQLEQSILPDTNLIRNDIYESFLQKTLVEDYCGAFIKAFRAIDNQGYLENNFLEEEITIHGETKKVGSIKQFTKWFSRFWKTDISIRDANRTVLYLHDELLNDESREKVVYTIKPHLMQYYQLHWFEDFCYEIIKDITNTEIKIINSYAGRIFNFYQNGKDSDNRELDIILGIEYNGVYKIIAIECKKTLSKDEVRSTNRKIKNKVLKSPNNVIDAYVHIGCFNRDVEFEKEIPNSSEKYKQGLIQIPNESIYDAPYYAFTISSIENLKFKICYIIKEIFEQW